jgi:signal transduction histidine kinase
MKIKLLLFLILFYFQSYSQQKVIDSLTVLTKTKLSDSLKIKVFGDLSYYYGTVNIDSAFYYGQKALDIAVKTNNIQGKGQSYNDLGILYYRISEFDKSISYYKKSLKFREQLKDTMGLGGLYNKLGIAYQRVFKMDSALFYNTKALKIFEEKNHTQYIALIKNNIANIYFNLKQFNKSLKEHLDVAEIRTQINDNFGLVYSYTNIGNSYLYLKDTAQSITYYKKGIELAEKFNYQSELATLYNNYGSILKNKNQTESAVDYYSKSLKLRETLNDNYGVASVLLNIGELNLSQQKINEAGKNIRKGLQISKRINANEKVLSGYSLLLSYFAHKRNTDSILKYQQLVNTTKDSILTSRITKQVAEIEEKYETAKKEKEIALQKEQLLKNKLQLKNRNLYLILLGAGLLILGIILFSLYKRSQHKKREYKQNLALKEAQTYSKLQDQRLRISRDLHDNIGSQLTFIISSINNLKFLTKNSDKRLKSKLDEINSFSSNAIAQLRDTIWAMNKPEITYENLLSRIISFVEKAKSAKNNLSINIENNIKSEIVFSSVKGINIFRVIQEAINNALKYAEATNIHLLLNEDSETISIQISDDGKGFNINEIELGNGLENMQNRINEIGGELTINSKIKEGTSILITCTKNKTNDV